MKEAFLFCFAAIRSPARDDERDSYSFFDGMHRADIDLNLS
jgi:hypothetical protein